MSWLANRIWRALYRAICFECQLIIWPWQSRHRIDHTSCHHAKLARLYAQAKANYGVKPWSCPECGWVPE